MFASDYLKLVDKAMQECNIDILHAVRNINLVRKRGSTLWVLGNGGSMAVAQHFAQDLVKTRHMRAQAINCPSVLTAYSNDEGFEKSFSMPLGVFAREGDGLVIFSCSGKSRNYAALKDWLVGPSVFVVGTDGGFLKDSDAVVVHVKSENYQVCETAFCVVADLINMGLEKKDG